MKAYTYLHVKYETARHFLSQLSSLSKKKKMQLIKIIVPSITIFGYLIYLLGSMFLSGQALKADTAIPTDVIQQGIAKEIIRFHVIGNSNSEKDQTVKLKVKEAVIEQMKPYLSNVTSKEEAKELILTHLSEIETTASKILVENGFDYGATAMVGYSTFPIKQYGDIVLPAGEYEALRIELGTASGKNWWCIMFPQLCFVDTTYHVVPEESKEQLQYLLTDEEYDAILEKDTKVTIHFKFVDWVKNLFD
ncbi:MAG: stage II sporulation protein R [Lachnospiraceae bacterium]|nr:stage II sporulation protein R [Lachnospiraceae bacterium]